MAGALKFNGLVMKIQRLLFCAGPRFCRLGTGLSTAKMSLTLTPSPASQENGHSENNYIKNTAYGT
jgi:hypothetical protein